MVYLLRFYFDNIEMIKFQFTVTERERETKLFKIDLFVDSSGGIPVK